MRKYRKINDNYIQIPISEKKHVLNYEKMPIVYYENQPIYMQVKTLLDRYNLINSSAADANDYFANPILKLYGDLVRDEDGETGLQKNSVQVVHL